MAYPEGLFYTKSHEWVKFEGETTATVGLTEFAQHALGDLVYVELPQQGASAQAGASFASVESVKAVSDVFSPVTGTVAEANEALADAPEMINRDPYGAWIARIEGITGHSEFLSAAEYAAFVEAEG